MTTISGNSFIGGQWVEPAGPEFQSFNPYTGESFNTFRSCGAREVGMALEAAVEAWRLMRRMALAAGPLVVLLLLVL